MENKTICFTGHRTIDPEDRARLFVFLDNLVNTYLNAGYTTFRVGGALGFDMEVEELLLRKRREEGRALRLELVLPCRDQAVRWSARDRRRYETILKEADSVEYICDTYVDGCMQRRNRAMVDTSAICVAYCKRQRSGTYSTVRYAKEQGVSVVDLADLIGKMPFPT